MLASLRYLDTFLKTEGEWMFAEQALRRLAGGAPDVMNGRANGKMASMICIGNGGPADARNGNSRGPELMKSNRAARENAPALRLSQNCTKTPSADATWVDCRAKSRFPKLLERLKKGETE
jgi:hypothetical protein